MMVKKLFKLPINIYTKLRRYRFNKKFRQIGGGIGSFGYGDKCIIEGHQNISIGKGSWINGPCELFAWSGSSLEVGDHVLIMPRSRIAAVGKITIGSNVLIGPNVSIIDHNHGMDPMISTGYSGQELIVGSVEIGDGCWIGQSAFILKDVCIGNHSIVGAGSVVTHDIPEYSIAAGNPAKVIKKWNFETHCWMPV